MKRKAIRVGDSFVYDKGRSCTVVEYINSKRVLIKFTGSNHYMYEVEARDLRVGAIMNPFYPVLFGVGYMGVGRHKTRLNGSHSRAYSVWRGILDRCYNEKNPRHKFYIDCTVSSEWHNFQVFAEWFNRNNIDGFAIDKDLRVLGSKVYSEHTCSFLPPAINSLLNDNNAHSGTLPMGVRRQGKKFQAQISIEGSRIHLGTYDNQHDAHEIYCLARTEYVRSMAEKYKSILHDDVYFNLSKYDIIKGGDL